MPPSHLRIFAWLVVCEEDEQTASQMQQALGLSAGAVSAATTSLAHAGIIERLGRAGERRRYHRLSADAWDRVVRRQIEATERVSSILEEALSRSPAPQRRLMEMEEFYVSMRQRMREVSYAPLPGRARRRM